MFKMAARFVDVSEFIKEIQYHCFPFHPILRLWKEFCAQNSILGSFSNDDGDGK